jgi:hypothetical protein
LPGLITVFDSFFLVVTEAFDCAETGFAVALDKEDFAVDVAFALEAVFEAALATVFVETLFGDFSAVTFGFATAALPEGLRPVAFFTTGLAADFAAATGFAFFAGGIKVFAGFFIAFAMESITN